MELIFKLPKDKLPFIGLRFPSEYHAFSLNRDLIINFKNSLFNIILEPNGTMINLKLINVDTGNKRVYEALSFEKDKLIRFINNTRHLENFNFGHVVQKYDKDEVVRVSENLKLFVLRVKNLSFLEDF
jgi:hypothetical protein